MNDPSGPVRSLLASVFRAGYLSWHILPIVLVFIGLPLVALFIGVVHPLVEPLGATRQQVGLVGGAVYCLVVFITGFRFLVSDHTDEADRQQGGESGWASGFRRLVTRRLKLLGRGLVIAAAGLLTARIGIYVSAVTYSALDSNSVTAMEVVGLLVAVVFTPVFLAWAGATLRPDHGGDSEEPTELSLGEMERPSLIRLVLRPVALLVTGGRLLTRRLRGKSPSADIKRTVAEIQTSLDTIVTHRYRLESAVRPPVERDAVAEQLEALSAEWRAVARAAGRLDTLAGQLDVTASPSDIDGLEREWDAMAAQWQRAVTHGDVDRLSRPYRTGGLASSASTVEEWATRQAAARERERDRLDSDPESVLASVTGSNDSERRQPERTAVTPASGRDDRRDNDT